MADFEQVERFDCEFDGEEWHVKRVFGGHRFTDEEVEKLKVGGEISFEAMSRAGKPYTAKGKLERQEYEGREYVGFKLSPRDSIPDTIAGHKITLSEREKLKAKERVWVDDMVSKKGNKFGAFLVFDGERVNFEFPNSDEPAKVWGGYEFTGDEWQTLKDGYVLDLSEKKPFISKKTGKPYGCKLVWGEVEDGRKRIVPEFAPEFDDIVGQ